jgi:excisionase family DNA binding protein
VSLEKLFSLEEAGEILGTGVRFPRRLVAERRIRYTRVGKFVRIPEPALAEFIRMERLSLGRLGGGGLPDGWSASFGQDS